MTDRKELPVDIATCLQVQKVALYALPRELFEGIVAPEHREHVGALFTLAQSGNMPLVVEHQGERYRAAGLGYLQDIITLVDMRALAALAASVERIVGNMSDEDAQRYWQRHEEAAGFLAGPDGPPIEVPVSIELQADAAAKMFEDTPRMPGQYL